MPQPASIEPRWVLLASLIAGVSFYLAEGADLPIWAKLGWKGAGVALLAVWALTGQPVREAWQIGLVMALGALGDVLLELDQTAGAVAFLAGHVAAMHLYLRNRRSNLAFSQRLLASLVVPVSIFVAVLCSPQSQQVAIAVYAFFVAGMAASAWTSSFPRYRTGIGAMMFLASDLLIFARMGPLAESPLPGMLIWPLYYFGQFLVVIGVVGTAQQRSAQGLAKQ